MYILENLTRKPIVGELSSKGSQVCISFSAFQEIIPGFTNSFANSIEKLLPHFSLFQIFLVSKVPADRMTSGIRPILPYFIDDLYEVLRRDVLTLEMKATEYSDAMQPLREDVLGLIRGIHGGVVFITTSLECNPATIGNGDLRMSEEDWNSAPPNDIWSEVVLAKSLLDDLSRMFHRDYEVHSNMSRNRLEEEDNQFEEIIPDDVDDGVVELDEEGGLTQLEINLLQTVSAGSDDTSLVCMVCLSNFEEGEDLRVLPCSHKFHVACIDTWLLQNDSCPIDRRKAVL